jgi:hypothetical protein
MVVPTKTGVNPAYQTAMSQLGQSRRFDPERLTSVLPPSTDIVGSARQVRVVPKTEVTVHSLPDRKVL